MESTSHSSSSISHLSSHHDTFVTESSSGSSRPANNKKRKMGASRLFRLIKFLSKPSSANNNAADDDWVECEDDDTDDDDESCHGPPETIFVPLKTKRIRTSSISIGTIIVDDSMSTERGSQRRRSSIDFTSTGLHVPSSMASSSSSQLPQLGDRTSDGRKSRNHRSQIQQVLHHRPVLMAMLLLLALAAGTLLDADSSETTATADGTATAEIQATKPQKERGKYLPASSSKTQDGIATDMYNVYKELQQEYRAKAFQPQNIDKWKVLNEKDGAKVSLLEHESDPTCPYVRMETTIPTSVGSCFEFLGIHNWHWSMPKMDPYYESHSVHANYTHQLGVNMILVRKKTHRILAFGKRDFSFLSVTDVPLADGTYVSGSVSVETPDIPRSSEYTRAFQDSIAFYKPVQDAEGQEQCHLTIVCRIDLNDSVQNGGFVPMWVYVKTVGATGIKAVLKMKHALMEMENEKQDTSSPPMDNDVAGTNSAPTASNLMSSTTPPTPSPGNIFPKAMAFFNSKNVNVEPVATAAVEPKESAGWWNRPRGGAFAATATKPAVTTPVEERWKPLYQVFTHVAPKQGPRPVANNDAAQAGERQNTGTVDDKLPLWLRRIPMLGDRVFGGTSSS